MKNYDYVIVGLGKTGISCVRYLASHNYQFAITDDRVEPPGLTELQTQYPHIHLSLGDFDQQLLTHARAVILSPGVPRSHPAIQFCQQQQIPVISDVELFAQHSDVPVIAITGSNGKSTVTSLVAAMAQTAGIRVHAGGNLGIPALDLLTLSSAELFVLELSSFQLESIFSLKPQVATILNISPDHMDRYADLDAYAHAKQRIYHHSQYQVINRDDPLTQTITQATCNALSFGLSLPKSNEFGITENNGNFYLCHGDKQLFAANELALPGRHNWINALAALAIGHAAGFAQPAMLQTLREFSGLAHRCQRVGQAQGVTWYNDSKGTNVGATIAAIEGLGADISGKVILLAGGQGKAADFAELRSPLKEYVSHSILYGEDAKKIGNVAKGFTEVVYVDTLKQAVVKAKQLAQAGDIVLLSPACASFDMFVNFEDRGNAFIDLVHRYVCSG